MNIDSKTSPRHWRVEDILGIGGARPQNLGGGAFEGQTHIWGAGQDRIFKKVLLFAHAAVTGLCPPPRRFTPSQKGAIFLGIPPPGDE